MNTKSEAEQAGILVLGRAAAMLAEAVTPLLIVRLLGKADVGALAGLMLIYHTLTVVLTAGFPPAVLYFLADRTANQRRWIIGRMAIVLVGLGALSSLFLMAIGTWGDAALAAFGSWLVSSAADSAPSTVDLSYLVYFALFSIFDIPARILPNLFIGESRPRGAASYGVLRSLGMSIGTGLPAALGLGLQGIIFGLTCVGLLQALGMFCTIRVIYRGISPTPDHDLTVGRLFRFVLPLGMTDIVNTLNAQLDRYLILTFLTVVAFAEYLMGAWEIPLVTATAYSAGAVYLPRFTRMLREGRGDEVMDLWRQVTLKISNLVVPICAIFIVGAEEFCHLVFTEHYANAAPILRLYCIFTMARVNSFGSLLIAAGRPRDVLRAAALTLSANALISLPLVLWLGFVGPALGTVLAFIPTVAFYCFFISRAVGVSITRTFPLGGYLKVVAVTGFPSAIAWWLKLSVDATPLTLLGMVAVMILTGFSLMGTLTGQITRGDWQYVGRWLNLQLLR